MNEYIIEIMSGDAVAALLHIERDGRKSRLSATATNYMYVRKFRSRDAAVRAAAGTSEARIVPSYGGYIAGTKRTVAPVQPKRNKSSPYRTI